MPQPADLLAFLRSRRSIRRYQDRPVEQWKLEQVIEAGRYAPSGQNRQALGFVVLTRGGRLPQVTQVTLAALLKDARRLEAARPWTRLTRLGGITRRPFACSAS